jgi:hypothetical protein
MKQIPLHSDVHVGPGKNGKGKRVVFYGPDDPLFREMFKRRLFYVLLTVFIIALCLVCIYFVVIHGKDIDQTLNPH